MLSAEVANAAVNHVMMKAPKIKENKKIVCNEEVICLGKCQHFTDKVKLKFAAKCILLNVELHQLFVTLLLDQYRTEFVTQHIVCIEGYLSTGI